MQSHYPRDIQLRVSDISVVFSGLFLLVLSSLFSLVFIFYWFYFHLIYFLWTMAQPKKHVRTLHDRLKIIEEVEKNPGQKRMNIAKRLRLSASTLNSIHAKKNEMPEQIQKCGNACKKRKTGKESTFAELETVLFTWYQQAWASNIPIDGTIQREKVKIMAAQLNVDNFSVSNG